MPTSICFVVFLVVMASGIYGYRLALKDAKTMYLRSNQISADEREAGEDRQ